MSRHVATDEPFHRRRFARAIRALILVAGLTSGPALPAQSSPACEFSVATIAATQLELNSAWKSYRT